MVGWFDGAVQVIDMSDPTSPVPVAAIHDGMDGFESLAAAIGIAIVDTQDGTYALVASTSDNAIQVIDVTDPADPSPAGVIDVFRPTHIDTATISGNTYALVASFMQSYVQLIDVTDPGAPSSVAVINDDEGGFDALKTVSRIEVVTASGSTYLLASGYGDNAIQVIDATDPAALSPAGIIADGDDGFDGLEGASSMATVTASGRTYVLVASYLDDAIQIIDMTDPLAPLAVTTIYDAQDALAEDTGMIIASVDPLTVLNRFDIAGIEARAVSAVTDA